MSRNLLKGLGVICKMQNIKELGVSDGKDIITSINFAL